MNHATSIAKAFAFGPHQWPAPVRILQRSSSRLVFSCGRTTLYPNCSIGRTERRTTISIGTRRVQRYTSSSSGHSANAALAFGPRETHFRSNHAQAEHGRTWNFAHCKAFHQSAAANKLKAVRDSSNSASTKEDGLAFGDGADLSSRELAEAFGQTIPPASFANRLLRLLHAQRVDGTLDLSLPTDVQTVLRRYPYASEAGLQWLRENYPVDEEAAILSRIEREEELGENYESPSELAQRGQNIGLYAPQAGRAGSRDRKRDAYTEGDQQDAVSYAPQSGRYQAKLSEKEGDVFGQSELEKIRARNEAEAEEEERQLEKQIEEIRAREQKEAKARNTSQSVAVRPEQGIEAAPAGEIQAPNEFEKWILRARNRARSELTLESPEVTGTSATRRILPSLGFVLVCCTGLYYFSQSWVPPRRSERLWPSMSLSFATIAGIVAVNAAVFCLWRFPPALGMLNRYFIVVPAYPYAVSMLGNLFSHHGARHLLMNMAGLCIFGPGLHEQVGRGTFMAIYLGGGLLGGLASLVVYVARGVLITSSMGASGCVWAVTAAYLAIHSNREFSLLFVPESIKEKVQMKGWFLLSLLAVIDTLSAIRKKNIDIAAHLGGMAVGLLGGLYWTQKRDSKRR